LKHKQQDPIGVFDSGLGGISTLAQGMHMLPEESFVYFGDSGVPPYALLPEKEVKQLCLRACDFLIDQGVKAILIACNTATNAALHDLQRSFDLPIVGIQPALREAATCEVPGKIIVMATEMMLESPALEAVIQTQCAGRDVARMYCRPLINLVESGVIDGPQMEACLNDHFTPFQSDAIGSVVLGCTHLGFLAPLIRKLLGVQVRLDDGNAKSIGVLTEALQRAGCLNLSPTGAQTVEIFNSGGDVYIANANSMLSKHLAYLRRP
jgi:glutamate racemase